MQIQQEDLRKSFAIELAHKFLRLLYIPLRGSLLYLILHQKRIKSFCVFSVSGGYKKCPFSNWLFFCPLTKLNTLSKDFSKNFRGILSVFSSSKISILYLFLEEIYNSLNLFMLTDKTPRHQNSWVKVGSGSSPS